MSFLERNMQALLASHPRAHGALARLPGGQTMVTDGVSRVRVQDTPSGHPTAVVDGILLHGRHDPRRDAAAQVERDVDPSATAIIVMGFGLGYGAEAARARFPDLPVLVVEPDADLFRAALAARDLAGMLADSRVFFHVDDRPEGVAAALEALPLARPAFLRLRPSLEKNPRPYRAAEEVIHSWLLRKDINVNTLARFGRLWVRNLARNMEAFRSCPGVSSLAGAFDGLPALIVAGGPSLDAVRPSLPALRERFVVIAVNTSVRPCQEAGVEPDFSVVVDPQYWASRYLDWTVTRRGVLVAEPSACPRVMRRLGAPLFLCSSLFPLGETLEAAVGKKGKLGAGGSVATSAWDLARLLGSRRLYTVGLDLGFPGSRSHCRGVFAEDLWFADAGRLSPVEGRSFMSLRDIGLFTVRSTAGGSTLTDRRMLLYKWWFENQLRMHPDVSCRTLSPDGAAIEGMPLASLDEALALPIARPQIDERMANIRAIQREWSAAAGSREALPASIDELADELEELVRLSARGRALSGELGSLLARGRDPGPCLLSLEAVDRKILAVAARNIAGFLIQSIIHSIEGEGERAGNAEEVVARSRAVYEGIEESARWQKTLLRRAAAALREAGTRLS